MKKVSLMTLIVAFTVPSVQASDLQWQTSYTLEEKGMYAEAAKQIKQLTHKSTHDEFIWLRLGWLNYLQGNYNDAKQSYAKALEKNSQSLDARLGLFGPLVAQKRWREASKYNQEVLDIMPRHLQANLNQMAIEEHNKEWRSLVRRASKISRYFPSSADALIYLARANSHLDNAGSARRAYEKVLMHYPNNLEARYYLRQNR